MKLTWIGHACFRIEHNGYTIITDPYEDGSVPGLANVREKADLVLCSHGHHDHCAADLIDTTDAKECPFRISVIDTYHDEVKGAKRGLNKIHIIDTGDIRIAHMGDIGCELEPEQIEALLDLDVIMIPIGGFYTINGEQAATMVKPLNPKHVIPMHFRDDNVGFGFDIIATVDQMIHEMGDAIVTEDCSFDTDADYVAKLVVLTPEKIIK